MSSVAAASGSTKKVRTLAETTSVIATTTTSATTSTTTASTSSSSSSSTALRDSVAGAFAGSASLLCGYPFDIVKTTQQAAPPGTYSSPWDAARAIARGQTAATTVAASGGVVGGIGGGDVAATAAATSSSKNSTGFRAFFRGASAPLVGAALETGVNYACYSASLGALSRFLSLSQQPKNGGGGATTTATTTTTTATTATNDDLRLTAPLPVVAAAAAVAGGALSFVLSPFELVKVRLQADAAAYELPRKAATATVAGATTAATTTTITGATTTTAATAATAGPASVIRATLAAEGVAGLTRGLAATAAREIPGNAIFFVTYEGLRRWFYSIGVDAGAPQKSYSSFSSNSSSVASAAAASVAAGGVAGGAMWALVLPVDSLKTRIQLQRPGTPRATLAATLRVLAREGGRRSLWAGLAPTLARAVPANAAQWLAFEAALSVWPKR